MTLFQRFKRLTFWNKLGVIASIFGIITFVVWLIPERSKPRPHFTLSLQIGNSSASKVFLTNDFLFLNGNLLLMDIANVGKPAKGSIFRSNSFAKGCLVIPVQHGETNKIFNFTVENDSAVKVTDLEAVVGFPKEWECGLGSKWQRAGMSLIIRGQWKLTDTNMQFFEAQSPWGLFPNDSLSFPPITNPCLPEYVGFTNKRGRVDFSIRSTGFECLLEANILFFLASSNFSKPFVTIIKNGSDGLPHFSVSQEEFEKSQK